MLEEFATCFCKLRIIRNSKKRFQPIKSLSIEKWRAYKATPLEWSRKTRRSASKTSHRALIVLELKCSRESIAVTSQSESSF